MRDRIKVSMTFDADTKKAKEQIRNLRNELNALQSANMKNLGLDSFDSKIQKSLMSVNELKVALENSMNVDTGRLDLNKFNQNLKSSGRTLKDYYNDLKRLGPEGQQAFVKIGQAIVNAEMPLRNTNTALDKMWTTMKNTMKWQLSSSVLHGFMGALQTAYGYAQDLNESLNNIRIVTGQSVSDMDKFAERANKAAKALSTTTKRYTDAALIYYQQGLSDSEVAERTNVTVKLANVTGESAETVSEWMTSIWNNFDDGSKSLESYADAITALGAATASSADEIAQGLEKFSAIAETVGLSYDYATAALATVTAQTRQSADVVGTAFKTLFARLEGLQLGETLDDGVTLNKYSEALSAVGISILDTNGDLRDMDSILNDLGMRWNSLSNAQQVALAQTVGGMRQYNQLIALMDNWSTFQENVDIARSSEGELDKQADIYAESWEAAQNRVRAAWEGIVQDLIDDEFIISITDGLADLLGFLNKVTAAMGGMGGVVSGVLALVTKLFGDKMLAGLRDYTAGFQTQSKAAQAEAIALKQKAAQLSSTVLTNSIDLVDQEKASGLQRVLTLQREALGIDRELTQAEHDHIQNMVQMQAEQEELLQQGAERLQQIRQENSDLQEQYRSHSEAAASQKKDLTDNIGEVEAQISPLEEQRRLAESQKIAAVLKGDTGLADAYSRQIQQIDTALRPLITTREDLQQQIVEIDSALQREGNVLEQNNAKVQQAEEQYAELSEEVEYAAQKTQKAMREMSEPKLGEAVVTLAQGISSLGFAINSLKSIPDLFSNNDITTGEAIFQTVLSLSMAIPMLASGLGTLKKAWTLLTSHTNLDTIAKGINTAATWLQTKAEQAHTRATMANRQATKADTAETNKNTASNVANTLSQNRGRSGRGLDAATKGLGSGDTINKVRGISATSGVGKIADGATKGLGADGAVNTFSKGGINFGGLKTAVTSLGKAFVAALPAIAAVAAAIAIITSVVLIAREQILKYQWALERAQKQHENLKKNVEETTEAAENLKNTISDYDTALESLNRLTKGTAEFKEALIQANEKALELIKTYGIMDYTVDSETGAIVIANDALDEAYDKKLQEQISAQNTLSLSEQIVNQRQLEKDRVDLTRDIWSDKDWGAVIGNTAAAGGAGAASGALLGAGLSSWSGPWALAGAIVGSVAGLATGAITTLSTGVSDETEKKALETLIKASEEDPNALAKASIREILSSEGFDNSLIEQFEKNEGAIKDLIKSNAELNTTNDLLNTTIAQSMAKNTKYDGAIYDALETAYSKEALKTGSDQYKQAENFVKSLTWNDEQFWDLYIKLVEGTDNTKVKYENWGGAGATRVALDENNQWVAGEKDAVGYDVASELLIKKIIEMTALDPQGLSKAIGEMGWSSDQGTLKEKLATAGFEAKGLEEMYKFAQAGETISRKLGFSEEEMSSILAEAYSGEGIDLTHLTRAQVEYLSQNLKKITSALGAETGLAIEDAINNYDTMIRRNNLEDSADRGFDQIMVERKAGIKERLDLTDADLEVYKKILSTTYKIGDNLDWWTELWAQNRLEAYDFVSTAEEAFGAINDNVKDSPEYIKAISKLRDALSAYTGSSISSEFIVENLDKIQAAITEGGQAAKVLFDELQEEIFVSVDLKDGIEAELKAKLEAVEGLQVEVGASLTLTKEGKAAIEELNRQILAGEMSTEEAEEILRGYGYQVTDKSAVAKQMKNVDGYGEELVDIIKDASYMDPAAMFAQAIKEKKKEREDQEIDVLKEIERYYEINEIIDDISRELDKLAKAKDRAFGADKLALMEAELAMLEADSEAYKTKIQEAEAWLSFDKQNLENVANRIGIEAKFDKKGRIQNYNEMHNALATKHNSLLGTNPEEAKALQDDFNNYIDKYTETLNTVEQLNDEAQEKEIEKFEKRLEQIDYSVQIEIDLNERQLKNLERLFKEIDDELEGSAERIDYITRQTNEQFENIGLYTEGIKKTLELAGVSAGDIAKYLSGEDLGSLAEYNLSEDVMQQLMNYTDSITDSYESIKELQKLVEEELINTYESWRKEIDETGKSLTSFNNIVNNYKNIVDIVGKDKLGLSDAVLKDLNAATVATSMGSLEESIRELQVAEAGLKEAEEGLATATPETEAYWKEQVDFFEGEMLTAKETLTSSWADSLKSITEEFQNNLQIVVDALDDAIAGMNYKSVESLQQAFSQEQEIADLYAEDYKKTYELNKLNRDIEKSISSTNSLKTQSALRDLQAEINEYKESGKEMSEYELEYQRKKYDLLVAEIALEEAQQAKNQVRLTRDASGNWGYVYTASETATEDTRQRYEDALYAMEELNDNYIENVESNIIANRKAMVDALSQLNAADYANAEEFYRARDEIVDYYQRKETFYLEQLGIALNNSGKVFTDTLLSITTGYASVEECGDSLKEAIGNPDTEGTLLGDTTSGYTSWSSKLSDAMSVVTGALGNFGLEVSAQFGDSGEPTGAIQNFGNFLTKTLFGENGTQKNPSGGVVGGVNETRSALGELANKAAGVFEATKKRAEEWQSVFSEKIGTAKGDVDLLNDSLDKIITKKNIEISVTTKNTVDAVSASLGVIEGHLATIIESLKTLGFTVGPNGTLQQPESTPNVPYYAPDSPSVQGLHGMTKEEFNEYRQAASIYGTFDVDELWSYQHPGVLKLKNAYKNNSTLSTIASSLNGQTVDTENLIVEPGPDGIPIIYYQLSGGMRYRKDYIDQYFAFDTGGYTGAWGSSGRLAMLHQKELVLNAKDTENFLAAVDIVRSLSDRLEQNALFASRGLDALFAIAAPAGGAMEQNVHIQASFPNATDQNEIKLALTGLINEAAQLVNRK